MLDTVFPWFARDAYSMTNVAVIFATNFRISRIKINQFNPFQSFKSACQLPQLVILKGSHVILDTVFPWFARDAYSMTNVAVIFATNFRISRIKINQLNPFQSFKSACQLFAKQKNKNQ